MAVTSEAVPAEQVATVMVGLSLEAAVDLAAAVAALVAAAAVAAEASKRVNLQQI